MNIRALNNTDIKVDTSALFASSESKNENSTDNNGVSFTETLANAVKSLEKSVQKIENMVKALSSSSTNLSNSSLSSSSLSAQAMLSGLSSLSNLSSSSSASSLSSTYGMSSTYSLDMLKLQLQDIVSETNESTLNLLDSIGSNTTSYGYGRSLSIIRSEETEIKVLQKI